MPNMNDLIPQPGDFILCHRKGFASAFIRWGERIRFRSGARWSHVIFVVSDTDCIEALTRGVVRTPLSAYATTDHEVVPTSLQNADLDQAIAFAQSCVGQEYGWMDIFGCALRFLTPGRGLWFGMNGTEICSGLVGQCLVRGWAIFKVNPSSMSPAELAEAYGARSEGSR